MKTNEFEIRLLIKGRPVVEYPHNGRTFIEGREGSEFEIEFINHRAERVEALISVDGLSVTDGKTAGIESTGYLVEPNGRITIPGWKLNNEAVAKFFFSGKNKSYSTQTTGSSANNGVIGAMVFRERHVRPVHVGVNRQYLRGGVWGGSAGDVSNTVWHMGNDGAGIGSGLDADFIDGFHGVSFTSAMATSAPLERSRSAPPSGARRKGIATTLQNTRPEIETVALNQLGTGFGRAEEFATTVVSFERGDLAAQIVVYYDNAQGLKARGIQVGRPSRLKYAVEPQAFPGMGCTPPKDWRA